MQDRPGAVQRTQNVGSPCPVHIGSSIGNLADRGQMDDMVRTKSGYNPIDRRDVVYVNNLNLVLAYARAMMGSKYFQG